jgi:hypothetical protein
MAIGPFLLLLDGGSAFVEVNVVRPATVICDARRAGAPR